MNDTSDRPWHDHRGTTFWKSMKPFEQAYNCSTMHMIENGANTKFRHDNWQGTPFKFLFPTLYFETHNKYLSVGQCANEEGWLLHFPALTQTAQNERDRLLIHLQQASMPQTQAQDTTIWTRSSGIFSTKSAYKFMSDTPGPTSIIRKIWQIKAPLRVTVFAWLMISNRLATIDNLTRRGWNLPNMCIMCKADAESAQHLFRQCPLAIEIRKYILNVIPSHNNIPQIFITSHSADLLTEPGVHIKARNWEITTSMYYGGRDAEGYFSNSFTHPSRWSER